MSSRNYWQRLKTITKCITYLYLSSYSVGMVTYLYFTAEFIMRIQSQKNNYAASSLY